jgi:tetratricopeptide (TPR) repeat protein
MLRAINFNNTAISEVKLGKYEQSIRQFSSALKLSTECLKDDAQRAAAVVDVDVAPCKIYEDLDRHLSGLLRSDGGCDRMKDGLYLFTRALSIPQIAAQSLESSALIIKVIMFNLGLSHQMIAIQRSGAEVGNYLHKARLLYRLCYEVETTQTQPEAQRQLLPAIANNLGIAYFKMQNAEPAVQCFDGIITMVMHANAIGDSTYGKNDNLACFLANTSNTVHKHCLPASAA